MATPMNNRTRKILWDAWYYTKWTVVILFIGLLIYIAVSTLVDAVWGEREPRKNKGQSVEMETVYDMSCYDVGNAITRCTDAQTEVVCYYRQGSISCVPVELTTFDPTGDL